MFAKQQEERGGLGAGTVADLSNFSLAEISKNIFEEIHSAILDKYKCPILRNTTLGERGGYLLRGRIVATFTTAVWQKLIGRNTLGYSRQIHAANFEKYIDKRERWFSEESWRPSQQQCGSGSSRTGQTLPAQPPDTNWFKQRRYHLPQ